MRGVLPCIVLPCSVIMLCLVCVRSFVALFVCVFNLVVELLRVAVTLLFVLGCNVLLCCVVFVLCAGLCVV